MMTQPATTLGKNLVVGDVVICGGKEARTITGFESHPGLRDKTARVLKSGDFGITVFDDEHFRKTSSGAWIYSHLWWSHEGKGK